MTEQEFRVVFEERLWPAIQRWAGRNEDAAQETAMRVLADWRKLDLARANGLRWTWYKYLTSRRRVAGLPKDTRSRYPAMYRTPFDGSDSVLDRAAVEASATPSTAHQSLAEAEDRGAVERAWERLSEAHRAGLLRWLNDEKSRDSTERMQWRKARELLQSYVLAERGVL